jgi:hypothetical protein
MSIRVTRFAGLRPAVSSREIDRNRATTSHNTRLTDGSLRPFRSARHVRTEAYDIKAIHLPTDMGCCTEPITLDHCASFTETPSEGSCCCWGHVIQWHHDCTEPEWLDVCEKTTCTLTLPAPALPASLALVDAGSMKDAACGATGADCTAYAGPDQRAYTYTWINCSGAESRPAPPTRVVQAYDDQTWEICGFDTPPPNAVAMRLYRTSSTMEDGSKKQHAFDTSFQLVEEIALPMAGNCYTDDKRLVDIAWGTLQTQHNCDPPACMTQVVVTEQGYHVGFEGNTLYVSERNEPHNWPEKYRTVLPDKIVAIAVHYDMVYIGTTGRPYRMGVAFRAAGAEADATIDPVPYPDALPCLARDTMVATSFGAMYVSERGIVMLQPNGGAVLVSKSRIGEDDWVKYIPNMAAWWQGKYVAVRAPAGKGFIFDITDRTEGGLDLGDFVTIDLPADAIHSGRDGKLYFAAGRDLFVFGEDTTFMDYSWRSKTFRFNAAQGLSAAKVVADFGAPVVFSLYVGTSNVAYYSRVVTSSEPFRLPARGRHLEWQVEIRGKSRVHEVHVGHSMWELARDLEDARGGRSINVGGIRDGGVD